MREISLTQGKVALVDDEDYERVSAFRWFAYRASDARTYYARRNVWKEDGRKTMQALHQFLTGESGWDHANRDGLDNRRENLRRATPSQQCANRGKRRTASTSQYKGVSWHPRSQRWQVYIRCGGKLQWLGHFDSDSEIDAARAYDAAAMQLFGPFAALNLPNEEKRDRRFFFADDFPEANNAAAA